MKKSYITHIKLFITCLVVCNLAHFSFAQSSKFNKAERLFETLNYKEASEEYKKAYEKGARDKSLFQHLGDSYYYNTDMQKASVWYAQLFENFKDVNPEYYFRYAHSLQGTGNHSEAKKWMRRFSKSTSYVDARKANFLQGPVELDAVLKTKANYELKNISTNSKLSDFGASFYGDNVVYASSKTTNKSSDKYRWNNQPFLNLYKAPLDEQGHDLYAEEDEAFSSCLNTQYHESNAVFNKDLTKVYFTRNNFKKKLGADKKGVNHLKLYSADVDEDVFNNKTKWNNIKELPFNSDTYSVGHPALSDDGKKLFFISDMPGSIGGTDIFVVDVLGNNEYSTPKNLGEKINTSGKEMFPFILSDKLYFASNGHLGFGGLDIFKSNIVNEVFQNPTNLGKPINSIKDDFGFVFSESKKMGFISSNRAGGKGDDDIYLISPTTINESCKQGLNGMVTNLKSGERIVNATLELYNEYGDLIEISKTNDIGKYNFKSTLDCNTKHEIRVVKQGFKQIISPVMTELDSGRTFKPLQLDTLDELIVEEEGILKLKIGIVYFDLDKSYIRNDAAIELNRIVFVMTQYPDMKIKIESHTDSRSPDDYNMSLSDRRAKSTREYLVSQGIKAERIVSAMGYGETQLINRCTNSTPCSEIEHELNRRSEFIIVKM